jgi:hypothetical protein
MSFWKHLFGSKKTATPEPESPAPSSYVERKPVVRREPYNVTGQYETVKALIANAVNEKRKTTDAAKRVSDTVGVGPKGTTPLGFPLKKDSKSR